MAMITSYDQAVALFATARKPEAGKPLAHKGWRMYKHGSEFAIYYTTTMVARLLPGSLLRMVLPDDTRIPPGIGYKIWGVLPVVLHRRSATSAKLHVIQRGNEVHSKDAKLLQACGYTTWSQFSTDGYKLYDGLTINLVTREVDYRAPRFIKDAKRNKDWLRKSKELKLRLCTIAKLGGFDHFWAGLPSMGRWMAAGRNAPTADHKALLLDALEGRRLPELIQAVGDALARAHYKKPSTAQQINNINSIFDAYSYELRLALGVITRA